MEALLTPSCCCPSIPLAVSIDMLMGKTAVRLVQQGIDANLPRWRVLRFRNEQGARCPLILLARCITSNAPPYCGRTVSDAGTSHRPPGVSMEHRPAESGLEAS
jgi:hypothetical protein